MLCLGRYGLPAAIVFYGLICGTGEALAHGFEYQHIALPVSLWLYMLGAGCTVAVVSVVAGRFAHRDTSDRRPFRINLLGSPFGRLFAHSAVLVGVKLAAVLIFIAVIVSGFLGRQSTLKNLAPTFIWVIWWMGLTYVSALLGNLWALINPWSILFEWAESAYHYLTGGKPLSYHLPYPRALSAWPGVILFAGFAWIDLIYEHATIPSTLARLTLLYSAITWAGMWCFGRVVWLRYGEAFSLVFGLFSRLAPTEVQVTDPAVCKACQLDCRDQAGDCINCYDCYTRAHPAQRAWNLRPFRCRFVSP